MGVLRKSWHWFNSRTGISRFVGPLARHRVPDVGWKGWWFVFGSATLTAFLVQVVTGIGLATVYVSSTSDAYNSLQYITNEAPLGSLLRGMHSWGAGAMTLLIGIHMARVFLMASYKYPREVNWLTGVVLLALTLAMGFTGQLLRWDQNAIWSVVVGAEQAGRAPLIGKGLAHFILGGNTLGAGTLSRFFSFHVFMIPGLIFVFVGFHLYLVLRNGISTPPKKGEAVDPKTYDKWYQNLIKTKGIPFWPDAAWRDVVFSAVIIGTIIAVALIVGPPQLDKPPDPTIIKAHPKPDWYFLWYFSILAIIPASSETYVILLFPIALGILFFILPLIANKGERHPLRRPWAMGVVLLAVLMIVPLWIAGEREPWVPRIDSQPLSEQIVAANSSAEVKQGVQLFHDKGCEYCHQIAGEGGIRGPDLTEVQNRLSKEQLIIRITNGARNMPAYGNNLSTDELNALVAFLSSQKQPNQLQSASHQPDQKSGFGVTTQSGK
jgi:ubiquinol-cytochrome c reductase cytochrome b subunit